MEDFEFQCLRTLKYLIELIFLLGSWQFSLLCGEKLSCESEVERWEKKVDLNS